MEKQIIVEEMAKIMLEESQKANVEPVLEMEGKEVVLGENATKVLNNILEQAFIPFLAEVLYNADYRKASEVAEEIFAEIEEGIKAAVSALQFENNPIHRNVKHETYSSLMRFIKSVEQKYTKTESGE